jgi:DNA repair photolyase
MRCGVLNAAASSTQAQGAFSVPCVAGVDVDKNMGDERAVRNDMETVRNSKRAAVRPTQYRFLPPPAVSYRPQMEHAGGGGERAKFIELNVKSLVNSPQNTGMKFWSINPYVGCELGCTYCYAHYAHRYVVERAQDTGQVSREKLTHFFDPKSEPNFSQHIFVKQRSAVLQALERDLVRIHKRSSHDNPATVAIGTATDPYQPAERVFGITRAILERLVTTERLELGITTKSPLICRDIDVLLELGRKHKVTVYISLICKNTRLIRCFEQHSPSPQARLRALSRLRDAGITAGINAAPVLPGITDSVFEIEALMAAAKDAGANFVHPSVLRIYPSVRDEFLPVIEQHFPNLVPRYRAAYENRRSAPSNYLDAIERRFERLARRYGIHSANPFKREERRQVEPEAQLSLL